MENEGRHNKNEKGQTSSSYHFRCRAPGRICLFGEHQDYLGMPVIAQAISLHCHIQVDLSIHLVAEKRKGDAKQLLTLRVSQLDEIPRTYDLQELFAPTTAGDVPTTSSDGACHDTTTNEPDFCESALLNYHPLQKLLQTPASSLLSFHIDCVSTSEIPMKSGCSSSTAFVTCLILVLEQVHQRLFTFLQTISGPSIDQDDGTDATGSSIDYSLDDCLSRHPLRLAQLAHHVEVTHFKGPGGTMDHVSIAYGIYHQQLSQSNHTRRLHATGPLRIGGGRGKDIEYDPWYVHLLLSSTLSSSSTLDATGASTTSSNNNKAQDDDDVIKDEWGMWILADSGEAKPDTLGVLTRCKEDRLRLLQNKLAGNWDASSPQQQPSLSAEEQLLWKATLSNRDIERQAASLWEHHQKQNVSIHIDMASSSNDRTIQHCNDDSVCIGEQLGRLMFQHHTNLRDVFHLSTKKIEAIGQAAMKVGAWGFKLVGSGGGGCLVVWCPSDDTNSTAICHAMRRAGAKKCWRFKPTDVANLTAACHKVVDDETMEDLQNNRSANA